MSFCRTISPVFFLLTLCSLVACRGAEQARESQPAATVSSALISLLPAAEEVSRWTMDAEPRFFDPGNLWEFIDGAADGYLTYGFEELVTADYSQADTNQQAVIDIYRMKDALNAYGIYSQERNPEYEFLDIGSEGYLGGTALNFWSGPYYVKITVFEETEELKGEMRALAEAVANKIGPPEEEPAEVTYFPEENQLPRTVRYLPRDVLGQSYLTNGFETQYRLDDSEYKMVIVTVGDSDGAEEALARYRQFLSGGGREVDEIAEPGEGGFIGEDSFYGTVIAVRSGNRIVVILGAPSVGMGTDAVAELVANIRQ